jgi:The GLUG motif
VTSTKQFDQKTIRAMAVSALVFGAALCNPANASVVISNGPTANMNCAVGRCTPTAKDAVLNVSDLQSLLNSGDVKVVSDRKAKDIVVTSTFYWASASKLTLDSYASITIQMPVYDQSSGALALITNDGGFGGALSFVELGSVSIWDLSNDLEINGHSYVLANDIATLNANIITNPSGYFALAKSYDASFDGSYKKPPIEVPFSGAFEGLGNTISNLKIRDKKTTKNVGLFATSSGVIADLVLQNFNVFGGDGGAIGGIVGANSGSIHGVFADGVTGDIGNTLGSASVGGIAGTNSGSIDWSISQGSVSDVYGGNAGGLVGNGVSGSITNSSSASNISGGENVRAGGLVGSNAGNISSSHASGAIIPLFGQTPVAGGLVGISWASGSISNSFATGSVTTGEFGFAGGLIGNNLGSINSCYATGNSSDGDTGGDIYGAGLAAFNSGTIANSYATGSVHAFSGYVGGLVGQNNNVVTASYSIGQISDMGFDFGGFVGVEHNSGGISDAYWDTDTSGIADPSRGAGNLPNDSGITGLTTKQLRSELPLGLDPLVWSESKFVNGGLPYLRALPPRH